MKTVTRHELRITEEQARALYIAAVHRCDDIQASETPAFNDYDVLNLLIPTLADIGWPSPSPV